MYTFEIYLWWKTTCVLLIRYKNPQKPTILIRTGAEKRNIPNDSEDGRECSEPSFDYILTLEEYLRKQPENVVSTKGKGRS